MTNCSPAYGLWGLVLLNSAVFLMFAFSFTIPQTSRDWRSFGAFAAFIVAFGGGFWLLSSAWHVLYHAQRAQVLATT